MERISAHDFLYIKAKETPYIIDVRSPDEYAYEHFPNSQNIPLDELASKLSHLPKNKKVYIVCQSGNRSSQACQKLKSMNIENIVSIDGGINQLKKEGASIKKSGSTLPIMRQVQIAAGSLSVLGIILSWIIHPAFIGVTLFVGLGLTFAGLSGFCGMAKCLEIMPWNKERLLSEN